jgi:hypothetical protein
MQLKASEPSRSEVQLFDFAAPAGVPPGYDAILRKQARQRGQSRSDFQAARHGAVAGHAIAEELDLPAGREGSKSTMTRLRAGKLKVEQWQLADGSTLLEASRRGRDDDSGLRAFEREVLQPLMRLKMQPLNRSKSAIGGDC